MGLGDRQELGVHVWYGSEGYPWACGQVWSGAEGTVDLGGQVWVLRQRGALAQVGEPWGTQAWPGGHHGL